MTTSQSLNLMLDVLNNKNNEAHIFTTDQLGEHINAAHAAYILDLTEETESPLIQEIRSLAPMDDTTLLLYTSQDAIQLDLNDLTNYITEHFPGIEDDTYFDYMPDAIDLFTQMIQTVNTPLTHILIRKVHSIMLPFFNADPHKLQRILKIQNEHLLQDYLKENRTEDPFLDHHLRERFNLYRDSLKLRHAEIIQPDNENYKAYQYSLLKQEELLNL